jgi:hypothetical protein
LLLSRGGLADLAAGRRSRAVAHRNPRNNAPGLNNLIRLSQDFNQRAGDRRRQLGVDLVGRDLDDALVDRDRVADLLEPLEHRAL